MKFLVFRLKLVWLIQCGNMKNGYLIILFSLTVNLLFAQNTKREPTEKIIADVMERFIENEEATLDYTDLQEQLEYYTRNPINLNKANRAQLERLVFLDQSDINAILFHRSRYGDFISVFEIQAIEKLDEMKKYYLSYFVTIEGNLLDDQTPFLKMPIKGKHEIFYLFDTELEQRNGYDPSRKGNGQNYYTGSPYRHLVRYRFSYSNRLYFGYTAEKDMGEPFSTSSTPWFDFNSVHFYYRPRKGLVKAIALGDYQANFGQGLVFGSGLAARKSAYVMSVKRSYLTLRPFRSLNENEFMRGAAVILGYKKFEFTPFFSAKYISTNLVTENDEEALSESVFSSIQLSGLHRTPTEVKNKHNVFQTISGGNLAWVNGDNRIGLTAVSAAYDQQFNANTEPYQKYNFSGKSIFNMGIDYSFQLRNINWFGEMGRSSNDAYAFTNGMLFPLDQRVDMILLYRNFSPRYQTAFANPFAEYSDARNEHALYSGLSMRLSRQWNLSTYFDMYRSPWLRYLTDGSSHGNDFLSELQYLISKTTLIYFRFRTESKLRNQADNGTRTDYLSQQKRTQYRLHAQYKITANWSARSRVECVVYADDLVSQQTGVLMFQDLSYSSSRKRMQLSGRLSLFNVDDYDARIYATESDVLYQYSVPLFQNSGVRYYIMAKITFIKGLDLWLRFSQTKYSNINSIGSGLETINSNTITDIRTQLRWTF